jgi:hypothetical protein
LEGTNDLAYFGKASTKKKKKVFTKLTLAEKYIFLPNHQKSQTKRKRNLAELRAADLFI